MPFDASFVDDVKALNLNVDKMLENPASAISSMLILMPAIITQFAFQEKRKYFKKFPAPPSNNDVFDYIIVGTGTAGSVLANRLSDESNNFKVLALEAGGPPLSTGILPAGGFFGIGGKETDWVYTSTKQKTTFQATANNTAPLFQGRGLGGSSCESLMLHLRGPPAIYDHWANIVGDDSWNGKHLKKYFKKSENYKGSYPDTQEIHGCSGEFPVEPTKFTPPPFILKAAKENNFKEQDITEPEIHAYGRVDSPIHNSIRYNAYSAFVEPVFGRSNLKVQSYAEVVKILFSSDNSKAIGVEYIFDGKKDNPLRALANKEVIISAGALNTPKLLQLSGIGPEDLLSSLNIPIVKKLPVGENLQDIIGIPLMGTYAKKKSSLIPERDIGVDIIVDEDEQNNGVLASNLMSAAGFYNTKQNEHPNIADIAHAHLFVGISKAIPPAVSHMLHMDESLLNKLVGKVLGSDGHIDLIGLLSPKSRGYVRIAGTDSSLPPIVDPQYFKDPTDLDRLVDGFKQIVKFYKHSKTFKDLGHKLLDLYMCEQHEVNSDAYFKCYAHQFSFTFWAFVGTCKMGAKDDPSAVTDSKLKIQGVENLRIVDSSIMPTLPNNHLIPTVFAIAEKGAEMIIQDAGGKVKRTSKKCKEFPPPKATIAGFINEMLEELGGAIVGV